MEDWSTLKHGADHYAEYSKKQKQNKMDAWLPWSIKEW